MDIHNAQAVRRLMVAAPFLLILGCGRAAPIDSVRRSGDTLRLRFATGRETVPLNAEGGESSSSYDYHGRVGRGVFDYVEYHGDEQPPGWILFNASTGRAVQGSDTPVFSPDSGHFATALDSWDNCAEADGSRAAIWRLSDSVPVREWHIEPLDCRAMRGWGATNPRWRGADTVEFTRLEFDSTVTDGHFASRPMYVIRAGTAWHVAAS
jgi:hypothetical protein